MADQTKPGNGTQSAPSLTDGWIDILRADDDADPQLIARGDAFTSSDLDKIASDYQGKGESQKAPLSLGFPDEHKDTYGVVDALQRKGDTLQARFSKVNPDLDHVYGRGVFTKKVASIKRTPDGISLERVGLLNPSGNAPWSGRGTPPLDKMMNNLTSSRDHLFAESSDDWTEIFRAGDYRNQGKGLITREDLARVARSYDRSFHEAPISVGPPEADKPAYGWISELAVDGDSLLAKEAQLEPWFAQARKARRFEKKSAGFYLGADGKIAGLRHVAYFGAQPPPQTGLRTAHFSEGGASVVEFSSPESRVAESPYVTALKASGKWLASYDEGGIPIIFGELAKASGQVEFGEGSERRVVPPAQLLAEILAQAWPIWENRDLDRRAQRLAFQYNLPYGDALTRAHNERVQIQREAMFAETGVVLPPGDDMASGPAADAVERARIQKALEIVARRTGGGANVPFRGRVLNQTAQLYAQRKNIPFGDALRCVTEAIEPQAAELVKTRGMSPEEAFDTVLADQSSAWMSNLN